MKVTPEQLDHITARVAELPPQTVLGLAVFNDTVTIGEFLRETLIVLLGDAERFNGKYGWGGNDDWHENLCIPVAQAVGVEAVDSDGYSLLDNDLYPVLVDKLQQAVRYSFAVAVTDPSWPPSPAASDVTEASQAALDADPVGEAGLVAASTDGDLAALLRACSDEIIRLRDLVRWVTDQLSPLAVTAVVRAGGTRVTDPLPYYLGDTARRVWPDEMLAIARDPDER